MYKLQKSMWHYNTRKHSFCARAVNMLNSLLNEVVEADTVSLLMFLSTELINIVHFDFNADLIGT